MSWPKRRALPAILLLAAALHASGIGRSILPAQDGLKFIRIARAFQTQPWPDVIRGNDQHPLYPALVALAEPIVALVRGHNPETWRIAAQSVAALASLLLLIPLHGLARELFGRRIAHLAALGFVLLPLPMTVGRDTLSDSLALLGFVASLRWGLAALKGQGGFSALACGVAAGFGYLARPEVLVAPLAVVATGLISSLRTSAVPSLRVAWPRLAGVSIAFLAIVGTYALVKGEVSEKLGAAPDGGVDAFGETASSDRADVAALAAEGARRRPLEFRAERGARGRSSAARDCFEKPGRPVGGRARRGAGGVRDVGPDPRPTHPAHRRCRRGERPARRLQHRPMAHFRVSRAVHAGAAES